MKVCVLLLLVVISAQAADAPKLTDAEKLSISRSQNQVMQLTLQMVNLEAQYRDMQQKREAAQKVYDEQVAKVLKAHQIKPEEWTLDQDLNLQPAPKKP